MKKPIYLLILPVLFLISVSFLSTKAPVKWAKKIIAPSVLAEDDEKDEEERDDDERTSSSASSSSSSSKPKKETVTTYVKLPDQIIKKLITETVYDSDGDGIFDPDDPNPNLHDIFIVADSNLNGIVDAYENEK